MEITLTDIHAGGRAVSPEKIYVSQAIPGETVEVVKERQSGWRLGRLVRVINPSSDRVTPFCPHAAECGGCPWQHMAYSAQLHWKARILEQALAKYDIHVPSIPPVLPSPLLQGYRNKTEYTFEAEGQKMGYHLDGDRQRVFDCTQCALMAPQIHPLALAIKEKALEQGIPFYRYANRSGLLRNLLVRTTTTGQIGVTLGFTRNDTSLILPFIDVLQSTFPSVTSWFYSVWEGLPDQTYYDPTYYHVAGAAYLEETACPSGLRFLVSPSAFYQPNPLQSVALYNQIVTWAQAPSFVIDLYTGIGTILSALASAYPDPHSTFLGIEGNAHAIDDARLNATRNQLPLLFQVGDILRTFTLDFVASHPQPDLIVLDPPRSGTLTEIKKAILAARPRQLIYVSCNPVSLAWDLKQLCAGGYQVAALQPFDMFPHTQHVETVVSLFKSC